jgi:hypothetical protein
MSCQQGNSALLVYPLYDRRLADQADVGYLAQGDCCLLAGCLTVKRLQAGNAVTQVAVATYHHYR